VGISILAGACPRRSSKPIPTCGGAGSEWSRAVFDGGVDHRFQLGVCEAEGGSRYITWPRAQEDAMAEGMGWIWRSAR